MMFNIQSLFHAYLWNCFTCISWSELLARLTNLAKLIRCSLLIIISWLFCAGLCSIMFCLCVEKVSSVRQMCSCSFVCVGWFSPFCDVVLRCFWPTYRNQIKCAFAVCVWVCLCFIPMCFCVLSYCAVSDQPSRKSDKMCNADSQPAEMRPPQLNCNKTEILRFLVRY